MGLLDKKEDGVGVDAVEAGQEDVRGDSDQGPAATPPEAPEAGTADLTQAQAGDGGKDQGAIDDELVPDENLDPEGRDEVVDRYPDYYMEGTGHIGFYTETKYPVEACVRCKHKHPKGQFQNCDNCGIDITECRGIMTGGEIVATIPAGVG